MQVQIRYLKADYVLETDLLECSADQFLGWYIKATFEGYPILSILWKDKGEQYKLIFGA